MYIAVLSPIFLLLGLVALQLQRWLFADFVQDPVSGLLPSRRRLAAEDLADLYNNVELPFLAVLAAMEWEGVRIDTAALKKALPDVADQFTKETTVRRFTVA